ncbi:hypothetical protein K492DRAFT_171276 [Lichtheimia hyalospora FSU 10163]|nr:hypothetical protein K492DRAFT_171276 [Lichtheimia hyalospora FSU 10163]
MYKDALEPLSWTSIVPVHRLHVPIACAPVSADDHVAVIFLPRAVKLAIIQS